jgi:LuxR family maltose regulon positive regulatory protein
MSSQSPLRNATSALRAKHTHPEVRQGLVDRQRLLDRLNEGLSRRLTLVLAPAGYGKTTILCQWLDSTERPSSWLSLDPLDNDLSTFAAYLLAAVRDAYPDAGENLAPLLSSPQPVPAEILADALIEDLATLPGSLILVLDDFHLVDDPAVMALMERLIQFLPSSVHVVLCSRADSGLRIARLRASGDLVTPEQLDDVRAWLDATAPGVRIIEATFGRVPPAVLLGELAGGRAETGVGDDALDHDHDLSEDGHTGVYHTWSLSLAEPVHESRLKAMLAQLPESVVRAKGFVYLEEDPGHRYVLQLVGRRWSLERQEPWGECRHETRLIFIGLRGSVDRINDLTV